MRLVVCVNFCKIVVAVRLNYPLGATVARSPDLASEGGGEGMAANPLGEPEPQAAAFKRSRFISLSSIMLM